MQNISQAKMGVDEMSNSLVQKYLDERNLPHKIMYLDESSATVALAAQAIGV